MSAMRAAQQRMQRRFPRLTLRVDVALLTSEGELAAVATTLGAGGLFVATDRPLPPRARLAVCFRLPGESELLRFEARVVWSSFGEAGAGKPGMGLEFEDPDARSEHAVRLERWAARNEGTRRDGV